MPTAAAWRSAWRSGARRRSSASARRRRRRTRRRTPRVRAKPPQRLRRRCQRRGGILLLLASTRSSPHAATPTPPHHSPAPPPPPAEAAELQAAIALSEQLGAESELAEARARLERHPEPPPGSKDVTSLRITLPSGAKVQRRFASADSLAVVRDFVYATAHELGAPLASPDGFELTCSYPKRTFGPSPEANGVDLRAAGLHPQAVLFVTPLSSGGSGAPAAAS
jgi:hypothetical protein